MQELKAKYEGEDYAVEEGEYASIWEEILQNAEEVLEKSKTTDEVEAIGERLEASYNLLALVIEVEAYNESTHSDFYNDCVEQIEKAIAALGSDDIDKINDELSSLQENYQALKELLGTTPVKSIDANNSTTVKVYTIGGQYIGTFQNAESVVVPSNGIYIVNDGKETKKVRF